MNTQQTCSKCGYYAKYPICTKCGNSIKQLYVFANEVTEWIIAESPEDAIKVWEQTIGEKYDIEECGGEFIQEDDDYIFTLFQEETTNGYDFPLGAEIIEQGDGWSKTRANNRQWADLLGRCYLGSSEY